MPFAVVTDLNFALVSGRLEPINFTANDIELNNFFDINAE
jgi:hypothetical protein